MIPDLSISERMFLGCLIRSPHEWFQVSEVVTVDCLSIPHHKDIFNAMRDLAERNRQITITSLQSALPEEFDDAGPVEAVLWALRESASEAGSATDYAPALAERLARRRLDILSEWVRKQTEKLERSAEDIAAEAAVKLQTIMATATPNRPVKLSDITKRVVTFSTTASQNDVLPGFTTGLAGLDEMTGLLMGGDFIGILGALGEGKSALMAQIGKHISRSRPVLLCSNEMSEEQNGTRAVAGESGMSVREIREGAYDFVGADAVKQAQKRIEALQYHVYTDPRMTLRGVRVRAMQLKQTIGLGAVLIDGAKRLRIDGKFSDRWERREETTGQLKELAIELGVPLLVAFHRTRAARRRDDPIPQLDDADFPSLEADADMVLAVWREEAWLQMNKPNPKAGGEAWDEWEGKLRRARGIAKVIALKVRSGEPFKQREFNWCGRLTTFSDL